MRDYWSLELIFSCKYVGQQVPMYVCPWAVCLCVWIYLSTSFYNIQNVQSECIQIHNVQESIQIHNVQESIQNFPECSRMHAEFSRMHKDCSRMHAECSRMHAECSRKYAECSRMHQECSRMHQECSRMHAECSRIFQNACRWSMSLNAGPWACMQLHKLACSYLSLHAVT